MVLAFELLAHVVVLVTDVCGHDALAITLLEDGSQVSHAILAFLEALAVVVANDIGERSFFHGGFDAGEMIEPFVAFGALRHLVGRHGLCKLCRDEAGIAHLILGIARMYVEALDMNGGTGGVEILIFQFAHLGSVHCVGPVGTKFLHVEEVCASTNLLIGVEGDADASVRNLMVFHQIGHGFHNLCDAGLVIGAEECVAVGDDEVFAHVVQHLGEHLGRGDDAFGGIEDDVTAVIVLNDAGVNVSARAVRAGVVVRNEPYGGNFGGDIGG